LFIENTDVIQEGGVPETLLQLQSFIGNTDHATLDRPTSVVVVEMLFIWLSVIG